MVHTQFETSMKFLESERKDVLAAIDRAGQESDSFTFLKRKGRVHIQYKAKEDFVFFRRKETVLTSEQAWKKEVSYLLEMQGVSIPMPSWNDVLQIFEKWLTT